jgi:hypothetical protein
MRGNGCGRTGLSESAAGVFSEKPPFPLNLWFPTEWEIYGRRWSSTTYETAANQARLGYYTSHEYRVKYRANGTVWHWWEASPYSGSTGAFWAVNTSGTAHLSLGINAYGFAPAFCVK